MRKTGILCAITLLACMVVTQLAPAANIGPGRTKITTMERVENHSSISDADGRFGGEAFNIMMITATRQLQRKVLGSVYYMNRYSFDDNDMISHIGGINFVRIITAKHFLTLGYSHSSNPQRARVVTTTPKARDDKDRFSTSWIWNLNNHKKNKLKLSSIMSYSTQTDLGEGRSLSEKLNVKVDWSKKWDSNFAYSISASLNDDEQLTNQYHANLSYQFKENTKITLGVMLIDNLGPVNAGTAANLIPSDDTVIRLSVNRTWRK